MIILKMLYVMLSACVYVVYTKPGKCSEERSCDKAMLNILFFCNVTLNFLCIVNCNIKFFCTVYFTDSTFF